MCAPFPHGYTVSRGVPNNCAFEITLSQAIMLTLLLVCAFSPRVHSIPRGPHFNKLFVVADGRLNLLRKLYFDFVKVIFRLSAEVKVFIHNLPTAQAALLKSHCRGGNAHSFACVRLFFHASTKVSCVGFITRNLPKGKQTP